MKTLYVGCALRGAPPEFVAGVEALKLQLEQHFTVLHFIGMKAGAGVEEIYQTDIALAAQADLMLAIVDMPSTGLGMEVAKRQELGRPTIIAHSVDSRPSAMVLGAAASQTNFTVVTYQTYAELFTQLQEYA